MKERWNELALREKQIVSAGAFVVSLLLLYVLIWLPLTNKLDELRNKIRHNQELLIWMQDADKNIQALEKAPAKNPTVHATGSLLSIVQKQINGTTFVSNLTQLHQVDSESIALSFQKVEFDRLIQWLTPFLQHYGLTIVQMSVTPSTTPGIVTADLVLRG